MTADYFADVAADFRRRGEMRQNRIARLSCCSGTCGAEDCVRCRGDAALEVIFNQPEDDE